MLAALHQARAGRLHILGEMLKVISAPREDYKPHAPRIEKMIIAKEFIGAVIGPGGKVIQEMQRETNTQISIEEINNEGIIEIASSDKAGIEAAKARIKAIVQVPDIGEVYEGKVKNIMDFGAFVEFLPGKDGLLHISEISWERLDSMKDVFKEGEKIKVKLIDIDKKTGKFRLSRKVLLPKPEGMPAPGERRPRARSRPKVSRGIDLTVPAYTRPPEFSGGFLFLIDSEEVEKKKLRVMPGCFGTRTTRISRMFTENCPRKSATSAGSACHQFVTTFGRHRISSTEYPRGHSVPQRSSSVKLCATA